MNRIEEIIKKLEEWKLETMEGRGYRTYDEIIDFVKHYDRNSKHRNS